MASFGERLRQEREQRGVTLDDISLSTKIGTRMLRALEEEHFDQLPGGIFNKGFIRAYARTLGMDEEQAIADYLVATGATPARKLEEKLESKFDHSDQTPMPELRAQLEQRAQDESPQAAALPWGTLAVVLILIALGFAGWGFYSRQSEKKGSEAAPSATQPANVSTTTTDQAAQPPQPKLAEAATPVSSPTQAPVLSAAGVQSPTNASATSNNLPPPAVIAPKGAFLVLIKAHADSWISITIDGEVTTQRTLAASSQRTVAAHQELVVRAGNVGALDFAFNGKKLPPQGELGEAKTLTFNAQGLQPAAPKAEASPPQP